MLSEKLYALRKSRGLTQEQLAEALGVSRQAVSKWESGASEPELASLRAISAFFGVSLDSLLGGGAPGPEEGQAGREAPAVSRGPGPEGRGSAPRRRSMLPGLAACAAGAAGLLVWGLVSILSPEASGQMAASSALHLDGNGLFLLLCAALLALGAALLIKRK